jgi:hypothetical protein
LQNYKYVISLFLPFFIILIAYLINSLIIFGGIAVDGKGILFKESNQTEFLNNPFQVFFGQILDTNRGLIPYAPVFLLIPAGVIIWIQKNLKSFLIIGLPGILFYIINTLSVAFSDVIWFAGWAPPARYIMDVIPFFIPALGYYLTTLKKSWISRINFAILSVISTSILLIYPFSSQGGFYSIDFGSNIFYEKIFEKVGLQKLTFFFLNFNNPGFKDYLFGLIILILVFLEVFRIYKFTKNQNLLTKNQL